MEKIKSQHGKLLVITHQLYKENTIDHQQRAMLKGIH